MPHAHLRDLLHQRFIRVRRGSADEYGPHRWTRPKIPRVAVQGRGALCDPRRVVPDPRSLRKRIRRPGFSRLGEHDAHKSPAHRDHLRRKCLRRNLLDSAHWEADQQARGPRAVRDGPVDFFYKPNAGKFAADAVAEFANK